MNRALLVVIATVICATQAARAQSTTASASTSASTRVAIATRDLARGNVLAATDMNWVDTTGVSAISLDTAHVAAGWVARRGIRTGEILRQPGVSRPDLVSNGDAVDVVYSAPGVSIKVRGTAIGSGGEGEQVYVRLDNRKRLRGVVAGANTVRVM